ncbi:MAG: prephenate dehydratase [Alphaproteobacteria bacterium]
MTLEPSPQHTDPEHTVVFQGVPGAYSDLACRHVYPDMATLPVASFEEAFAVIEDGRAALGMIPIENSVAGRVADIHALMPTSTLHIVAEHFQRVNHHLLAVKGATISDLGTIHSHVHAISQCRKLIRELGVTAVVHADTAGAAADVAARNDPSMGAIASALAADIYGLQTLRANIEDAEHNTTRFVILAKSPVDPNPQAGLVMTSFLFRVRNIPAALYKSLGGFASNGVNMTKLESYMVGGSFAATQFYAEIEGHPEQKSVALAMEELNFFSDEVRIFGVYAAHPFRAGGKASDGG